MSLNYTDTTLLFQVLDAGSASGVLMGNFAGGSREWLLIAIHFSWTKTSSAPAAGYTISTADASADALIVWTGISTVDTVTVYDVPQDEQLMAANTPLKLERTGSTDSNLRGYIRIYGTCPFC